MENTLFKETKNGMLVHQFFILCDFAYGLWLQSILVVDSLEENLGILPYYGLRFQLFLRELPRALFSGVGRMFFRTGCLYLICCIVSIRWTTSPLIILYSTSFGKVTLPSQKTAFHMNVYPFM